MSIKLSEGSKGPTIYVKNKGVRGKLIEDVLHAWKEFAPKPYFRNMINYLTEVTKVEHNNGAWRSGQGMCSLRLPADLFHSLRIAFEKFLPDEPAFGRDDSDIQLLYEIAPKLMGNRKPVKHRGK